MSFKTIDPTSISTATLHSILLGAVTPRPIAFASTINKKGEVNVSPFSFFNVFSAKPPILIFSPARRVRDNTIKHTLENVQECPEVVINIVNHAIVEQVSLASTEYDKGINEFIKAGLTEIASEKVQPPRVKESPVSFECKVNDIIPLGESGGAGNLVICEVVLIHINQAILDLEEKLDPIKLDVVGRLGGNWYTRVNKASLFEIPKPIRQKGIGIDNIPDHIKYSDILTGNDLARLGNVEKLPDQSDISSLRSSPEVAILLKKYKDDSETFKRELHLYAQKLIENNQVHYAWCTLLQKCS